MLRKAVLISYPGVPKEEHYCPGVYTDIKNYTNYLCSPLGGGWRFTPNRDIFSEIKIFESPKRRILLPYLEKLNSYDYVIIVFCGHGGYSLHCKQTSIEINESENVLESEL